MVETLPKLRRMMWTGTLMSNAKAQLLSILTAKNIAALRAHLWKGTAGFLRKRGPEGESCEGRQERVVRMNWVRD